MAGKNITITETGDIEKMLSTLPKEVATGPVLGNALAAAGKAVIRNAKPRVPRGDPKHHPENKALWRTFGSCQAKLPKRKKFIWLLLVLNIRQVHTVI
jgi:hypothetical protein